MADIFPLKKPSSDQVQEFVADASLQIDIGDLVYLDVDDAKPASSQADQLSETLNQALFARNFVGIAVSSRQSTDSAAGVVRVQTEGLVEYPCVSSTFEIGDLVGADEAGSGTALEDQQVRKVTSPHLAIGRVVERYSSATTKVWIELINRATRDQLAGTTFAPAAVAAAGSAQGDAGALSDGMNYVSAADGTKGVVLPTGTPGRQVRVYNLHASNGLKVYPHSGGDINDGTGDAAVTIEGKTLAIFECVDGTTWAAIYTANS